MNDLPIPLFMEQNNINCPNAYFNKCLNSLWCGFLNGEKKVKKKVKKMTKIEPIKRILNDPQQIIHTPEKIKDVELPTVNISELINIYNIAIDLYHTCQNILVSTINHVLEYDAVKPLIINEFKMEKTTVYPTKEVLELVNILKDKVLNILTSVHELVQIINILKFEAFSDIEKKLIDNLKSNGFLQEDIVLVGGGATLTDVHKKILDIKEKLKILSDSFANYDFLRYGTKFKNVESLMSELNKLRTDVETVPEATVNGLISSGPDAQTIEKTLNYYNVDLKNTIIPDEVNRLFFGELSKMAGNSSTGVALVKHTCLLGSFGVMVRQKLADYKTMISDMEGNIIENNDNINNLKNMRDIEYNDDDFTFIPDVKMTLESQLNRIIQDHTDTKSLISAIKLQKSGTQLLIDKNNIFADLMRAHSAIYAEFIRAYQELLRYDGTVSAEIKVNYGLPPIIPAPTIVDIVNLIRHLSRLPDYLALKKRAILAELNLQTHNITRNIAPRSAAWQVYVNKANDILRDPVRNNIEDFITSAKIAIHEPVFNRLSPSIIRDHPSKMDAIKELMTEYKRLYVEYNDVVSKYNAYGRIIWAFGNSPLGQYAMTNEKTINVLDLNIYITTHREGLQKKMAEFDGTIMRLAESEASLLEQERKIRTDISTLQHGGPTIVEPPAEETFKRNSINRILAELKSNLELFNAEVTRCAHQIETLDRTFSASLPPTIQIEEAALNTQWYITGGGGIIVETEVGKIKNELAKSANNFVETTKIFQELAYNVDKFKSLYSSRRDTILTTLNENQLVIYHIFYIMTILTEILNHRFDIPQTLNYLDFNRINDKIQASTKESYFGITINRAKIFGTLLKKQFIDVHGGRELLKIDQHKRSYIDIIVFIHVHNFI